MNRSLAGLKVVGNVVDFVVLNQLSEFNFSFEGTCVGRFVEMQLERRRTGLKIYDNRICAHGQTLCRTVPIVKQNTCQLKKEEY